MGADLRRPRDLSPTQDLREGPRTSLILLGSTVCSVHATLELLLLQGIGLATLRKAENIYVKILMPLPPGLTVVSSQQSQGGRTTALSDSIGLHVEKATVLLRAKAPARSGVE